MGIWKNAAALGLGLDLDLNESADLTTQSNCSGLI